MSPITTHILDTARGCPAPAVPVTLECHRANAWHHLATAPTNADGRIPTLLPDTHSLAPGLYRLTFDVTAYFAGTPAFYPSVQITFQITDPHQHYHIPLLLSPFGYSTYRGS